MESPGKQVHVLPHQSMKKGRRKRKRSRRQGNQTTDFWKRFRRMTTNALASRDTHNLRTMFVISISERADDSPPCPAKHRQSVSPSKSSRTHAWLPLDHRQRAHLDTATKCKSRRKQHGAGKPREPAAGTAPAPRSAGVLACGFWQRPAAIFGGSVKMPPSPT